MSADAAVAARTAARDQPPWELVLLGLTVLSLALIPIHIHRAFGLPAHPLLLHVPVVLVPVAGIAALALLARRMRRGGPALAILRVAVAMLAVLAVFLVIRTGHLGAQLTWEPGAGGPPGGGQSNRPAAEAQADQP